MSSQKKRYSGVGHNDTLKQGVGYWIIQKSGSSKTVDIPDGCLSTPVAQSNAFEIPLSTQAGSVQWNMVGYPFTVAGIMGDLKVVSNEVCASACTLNTAKEKDIVHNEFWSYTSLGYTKLNTSRTLNPWMGYG